MEEEGLRELTEGIFSPCAEVADELREIYTTKQNTENNFEKQAGAPYACYIMSSALTG